MRVLTENSIKKTEGEQTLALETRFVATTGLLDLSTNISIYIFPKQAKNDASTQNDVFVRARKFITILAFIAPQTRIGEL
jgi:hypothetical protein